MFSWYSKMILPEFFFFFFFDLFDLFVSALQLALVLALGVGPWSSCLFVCFFEFSLVLCVLCKCVYIDMC